MAVSCMNHPLTLLCSFCLLFSARRIDAEYKMDARHDMPRYLYASVHLRGNGLRALPVADIGIQQRFLSLLCQTIHSNGVALANLTNAHHIIWNCGRTASRLINRLPRSSVRGLGILDGIDRVYGMCMSKQNFILTEPY